MKLIASLKQHPALTACSVAFLLLLTLGGGMAGASRAVPSYQSDGVLLVIPPGAGSEVATMNPFVNLTSNISQLTQALSTRMTSPDVVTALRTSTPSVTDYQARVRYDEAVVNSQPTPQMQITVVGTDPGAVQNAVRQLMVRADSELAQIQRHAGVRQRTMADTVELVPPTSPQPMPVSGARAAVVAALGALFVGLAVLVVLAAIVRLRQRLSPRGGHHTTPPGPSETTNSGAAITGFIGRVFSRNRLNDTPSPDPADTDQDGDRTAENAESHDPNITDTCTESVDAAAVTDDNALVTVDETQATHIGSDADAESADDTDVTDADTIDADTIDADTSSTEMTNAEPVNTEPVHEGAR